MTPAEAHWLAQGYAWAREDQAARDGVIVRTAAPAGSAGSFAFAEAYARGRADYNAGKRGDMIPVSDAWEQWQLSGGRSVFRPGDSTAEQRTRRAAFLASVGA